MNNEITILRNGGIGVIATDTIYGIVGQALRPETVSRIYIVKKRTPTKPFIMLVSSIQDLALFNITLNDEIKKNLEEYWPGPVSIILDCTDNRFEYLHRGTSTLAFRLPAVPRIVELLKQTGPLVAPSANPEGLIPAQDIPEAEDYFGEQVDFYSEGPVNTKPSKIIRITDGGVEIIRP